MVRGNTILALLFVFVIAVVGVGLPGPSSQAQVGCTKFEAIVQGILPSPLPLVGGDSWGGPIYASLGGEFLAGNISGTEEGTAHGTAGHGRGTTYKVCFGPVGPDQCKDSFTYEAVNAVWPVQPGKVGMGYYQANSAKIVEGSGRFQFASGNLNVAGPFIVWPDSNSIFGIDGRWNAEIKGNICGVQ